MKTTRQSQQVSDSYTETTVTPVTLTQFCEHLSPLSPLAHLYVCLSRKTLQKNEVGYERHFRNDFMTGDSGDSGDTHLQKI
ncbi:MAG: hypothetical protein RIC84_14630 [Aggregatilineales bacterium]